MDKETKKKISNEKRLKALKQWKSNLGIPKTGTTAVHKFYDTEISDNQKNKFTLFHSDDEVDENYEDCFNVRPQFEGPHGQQLLEMSSMHSERFKLDERFKEDDESEEVLEKNEEKEKNLKILETILGHQIPARSTERSSKKRHMRFDPEDKSATEYIKTSEAPIEKPKKKKSKKENVNDKEEPVVPISTEHYVEVSSNLKNILNSSSTPFCLSQKFNHDAELEPLESLKKNDFFSINKNVEEKISVKELGDTEKDIPQETNRRYFHSKLSSDPFFITKNDPRLKEGVQFFRRPKPLEDIRMEWQTRRESVLELLKKKKRSSQRRQRSRSHSTRVKSIQFKNSLRKQNFKY